MDVTLGLMSILRMLPQSRVWWMGHMALWTLLLLKHFACSLAVQQRLSRAPCSPWLSSCVPVAAAGVRLGLKEWGTAHSCGAVSFPAQTRRVRIPSRQFHPGKPPLLQVELRLPDVVCRLFSVSAACNSHQGYRLQAGRHTAGEQVLYEERGVALVFSTVPLAPSNAFSQNLLMSSRPFVWSSFYSEYTECCCSLGMSDCCLDTPLCIPEPQNHSLVWVGTSLLFLFFFPCWKAVIEQVVAKEITSALVNNKITSYSLTTKVILFKQIHEELVLQGPSWDFLLFSLE